MVHACIRHGFVFLALALALCPTLPRAVYRARASGNIFSCLHICAVLCCMRVYITHLNQLMSTGAGPAMLQAASHVFANPLMADAALEGSACKARACGHVLIMAPCFMSRRPTAVLIFCGADMPSICAVSKSPTHSSWHFAWKCSTSSMGPLCLPEKLLSAIAQRLGTVPVQCAKHSS